jgi:hypothetical protein
MNTHGSISRRTALGPPAASVSKRFYEPDSVRVMADALEFACRMLPEPARENENVRRRLARNIMREVDAGEDDPARLAASAVLSVRL